MKLKIPSELSDITLNQAQRILLIDKNPDIDTFAKKVHVVAIVCGITAVEAAGIHLQDLNRIYNRVERMIAGAGDAPLIRRVSYLGREYAFIEDVRDMETGAFIDIDEMAKAEKYAESLHKIMAILYRPIDAKLGGRYRLKSYVNEDTAEREERQSIFLKHMTLDVVRGAAGFFLPVMLKSCGITANLSRAVQQMKTINGTVGVGSTSFMPSPDTIL